MKTIQFIKLFTFAVLLSLASPAFATVTETSISTPVTETPEARIQRIQNRIDEIKAMDKSEMTRAERKALKKEVRAMRDEVKALSGGVYISIGALLVIILLLILLL
jgi:hypothetical protein